MTTSTTTTDRELLTDAALAHGWRPIPYGANRSEFRTEDWVLTVWFDRAGRIHTVSRPVPDLSRFDAQHVLRTVEQVPFTANRDQARDWVLDKLLTAAAAKPAPTTNAERAQYLTDLYVSRVSPLHADLYALMHQTRQDPLVSRALLASLSTVCQAVSTLSEAINAATELIDAPAG